MTISLLSPSATRWAFTLLLALILAGCASETETQPSAPADSTSYLADIPLSDDPFVHSIEVAHEKGRFLSHEMVAFDLQLTFGGRERFNGTISLATNTGLLRQDGKDGVTVLFDGENVYQMPDTLERPGSRFDIFTWTYFFALPFKLDDPGTIWNDVEFKELEGKEYDSKKLTFEDGTGDSSLDWYIVYSDPESQLIHSAAYIVTMYSSQEEAEVDPHAIVYEDYQEVDGIPIARKWTFWGWRENEGLTDQLGSATVSNIRFSDLDPVLFQAPESAKRVDYIRPEAE